MIVPVLILLAAVLVARDDGLRSLVLDRPLLSFAVAFVIWAPWYLGLVRFLRLVGIALVAFFFLQSVLFLLGVL